ncbi:MAG: hypothetical protein H7X88_10275 [Gloeobacteraceae cyanobacterium ES-bin-316]|nr:hypothetical protein [Ferruginibacter sp.]
MKIINSIIIACLFFIFQSCNPSAGKEPITEFVKLNAELNNTNETISLGDTLEIKIKLPDTIVSNLRLQNLQSLQRGFFGMRTFKVDTVNRKGVNILFPVIWTSVGSMEGNLSYVLKNSFKPYEIVINFKPTEKGLYYLEVVPQPGVLRINNNYEANLLVNFGVTNKHYNILGIISPFFGGQAFYDAFIERDVEGFGAYFFRVN